jgi:hypothetical protein
MEEVTLIGEEVTFCEEFYLYSEHVHYLMNLGRIHPDVAEQFEN